MDGRYCAYLRKSRADEVREKVEGGYDALAHHRQTLQALADRMGVEIGRWYCDGIKSGDSLDARPEMRELLDAVEHGEWDGVLCMEVERLTRGDMVDQGTVGRAFTESGTLIVTPLKVYDPQSDADMEYFEFGLFMSRREYKAINKRLVAGREAAVREGQYIAKSPPWGYDKAIVDNMRTLVPNADAPYVVAVFQAYAEGKSYREICKMLTAMGAATRSGRPWSANTVRNMVRNPVYVGKVAWNRTRCQAYRENGRTRYRTRARGDCIVADGLHEAIVSDELWEAAQNRVAASPVRGEYKPRNHYGRILVCAECGKALHYTVSGNSTKPMLVHLHRGEGCQTKGCTLAAMDAAVSSALADIAADLEISAGSDAPDMRRSAYEKSIADARAAIDANLDRMERGVITEDDFVRRRAVLESRIADATAALDAMPPDADDMARRAVTLRDCVRAIADPDVSCEAKRLLIWSVVDRIEYKNRAPFGKSDIHLDIFLRS